MTYRSVDKTWTQWGWTVANQRWAADGWSLLANGTTSGFALTGTSKAVISTPAAYVPGSAHTVRVWKPAGASVSTVRADPTGRLNLTIDPTILLGVTSTATVTIS